MFGEEYVFQYIKQEFEKEQKREILEIYITDALQCITENTARFGGGKSLSKRYWDMIDTSHNEPQRTSEEIIATISKQLEEMAGKEEKQNECI